ncbi:hypothetical protein ACFXPQ_04770 [Streptomyces lydicus]|uniref:hypothetical protein n=1 Tax=Streptomyces lydicus TaxID=47763 RepID=UPI0036AF25FC
MTTEAIRGPVRFLTTASFVTTVGSGLCLAGSMLFFTRVVGLSVSRVSTGLAVATLAGLRSGFPLGAAGTDTGSATSAAAVSGRVGRNLTSCISPGSG